MKISSIFNKKNKRNKQLNDIPILTKNDVVTQKVEKSFIAASTNIGKRSSQQDYYCISSNNTNDACICILCDGMGGMEGGELASKTAAESVKDAFREFNVKTSDPFDFLENAIFHSDMLVSNLTDEKGNSINSGTTIIISIIIDNSLYWASVGDSRIYIIRDNSIQQITKDQNYGEILLMQLCAGEITVEDANADPQKDALTHYVGIGNLNNINMPNEPLFLQKNDIILMCSDGLYRTLENDDILNSLHEHNDNLSLSAWLLVTTAINKNLPHQDNTTVILIRCPSDTNAKESLNSDKKIKDSENQINCKLGEETANTNHEANIDNEISTKMTENTNSESIKADGQRQRPNNGVSVTEIIN